MSSTPARAESPGGQLETVGRKTDLIAELIVRRRRSGLALLGLAVLAMAMQGKIEWVLPYDYTALRQVEAALGVPGRLTPLSLAWGWALPSLWLLWFTHRCAAIGRLVGPVSLIAGLLAGSCRIAAGGAFPAVMMQMLVGIMTLGWMGRREGGAGLLLGTTVAVVGWDTLLSETPTLWLVAPVLMFAFMGINHFHLRANDQRLRHALAEQHRLINDLDTKREHLVVLQSARTKLLAGISHDLRQPLQAVRLYGEALLARVQAPPLRELLAQQVRAADDAAGMLDQFSDFTALEQGALNTVRCPVNVRQVLDDVADRLRASHESDELQVSVYGRHAWIQTDPLQLTRIVQNLASNAVRYSLRLRPAQHARVVLSVRRHDRQTRIAVLDNGPGIPADKLEVIFEPYVQLHVGTGSKGGQGLGLSIVQGLVQQLGLRLAPVRSVVGRGTQFCVVALPDLHCEDPDTATQPPSATTPDHGGLWIRNRVIAVLDDDDRARAGLVTALEYAGAYCISAPTLTELMRRIDDEPRFPDAVVFDLDLGATENGIAALERLRAELSWQQPAAIISGGLSAPIASQLPVASFFLRKPASTADLSNGLEAIAEQLVRFQASR